MAEFRDLDSGWAQVVEEAVAEARANVGASEHIAMSVGAEWGRRVIDWPAVPQRPRACLGRERADRLADKRDDQGDIGRRMLQDEYAEWRLVQRDGRPTRFELTTELPEYWELLARRQPQRALDVLSEFAQRPVTSREVFRVADPGELDARQRATVARKALAPGRHGRPTDLNNGVDAITCLSHTTSTLGALARLVVGSATPMFVRDSMTARTRVATASEFIGQGSGFAEDCRGSDPVVVERIVSLACDGRRIAFDDPLGIYVVGVQAHELLTPVGDPVPSEWFCFSRGTGRGGVSRYQRLTFTVPPDQGFTLADLRSRRTGEPIRFGAQIAELVQVGVYLQAGPPNVVAVTTAPQRAKTSPLCGTTSECEKLRARAQGMEPP